MFSRIGKKSVLRSQKLFREFSVIQSDDTAQAFRGAIPRINDTNVGVLLMNCIGQGFSQ